jgi:iron complex outermembrane receptor protein
VRTIPAYIITAIVLSLPAGAHAQSVALGDTVYSLPGILVEAERISDIEYLENHPAFISIIPTDDVSRRVSSAADYLSQAVGFHVKSTGGYGAYSTASVRGSSAKQVSVFLDGIPLNRAQSGVLDLADIPVSSLSRIEVYRGFGPYDLSGSSIGGVINLVTENPDPNGGGQLSLSLGSLSTQRYRGSYSFSRSDWNVLAVGSLMSTKGNYEFLDDNGTPYNQDDDEAVERINNGLDEYEALIKASGPLGGGTLVASNQFYSRRQGLPGYSAIQSKTERLSKVYDLTHVAWRNRYHDLLNLGVEVGAHFMYQLDSYEDDKPAIKGGKPDEKNRTLSYGGSLRWKLPLPDYRQFLRGLIELRRESFRPEESSVDVEVGESQVRSTFVLTLEDEFDIWGSRVRLLPSARYERYCDHTEPFEDVRSDMASYFRGLTDTSVTHSRTTGGIGQAVSCGAGITLKANYGRYHRVPTLMEIFGYRGVVVPNTNLKAEQGTNRDLGLRWKAGLGKAARIDLEFAYFWSDVEDLIMYVHIPWARAAQAVNINSAEIEGYEISLGFGKWRGLSLSGNLTYLRAVDTGPVSYTNGKSLPNRPEHEASVRAGWDNGGFSVFYEFDYIGGNYWNAYNGVAPNNKGPLFDIRRIHSAGVTVPTGIPRTDLTVEIKNIGDERYEDVMGYPLPGRSLFATLRLEL